jgi:hypothetical protein
VLSSFFLPSLPSLEDFVFSVAILDINTGLKRREDLKMAIGLFTESWRGNQRFWLCATVVRQRRLPIEAQLRKRFFRCFSCDSQLCKYIVKDSSWWRRKEELRGMPFGWIGNKRRIRGNVANLRLRTPNQLRIQTSLDGKRYSVIPLLNVPAFRQDDDIWRLAMWTKYLTLFTS